MSRTQQNGEIIQEEDQNGNIQEKNPWKNQEKFKDGAPSYVFNLDDTEIYIGESVPTGRPDTLRGIRAAVKQFLKFGEEIKKKKKGTKITELEAKITYSTIRAYNNHQNTLKSDTYLGYVRSFLLYFAKKRGDQTLRDWAESLVYNHKESRSLFVNPGEKASVTWKEVEHDLKAFYAVVIDPATPKAQQKKKLSAYRTFTTLLFGITTGMRPQEIERLEWTEINKESMDKGYFIIPSEKTKTNASRVIPLHPAVIPYLELLTHLYEKKPFDVHNYRKYRKRDGGILTIAQARNFAAKKWYNVGINEKIRIAIMGHDEGQIKKEIEEEEEHVESTVTDKKYRRYGITEITRHYQETIGAKFNPIPKVIDFTKIKTALKPFMKS